MSNTLFANDYNEVSIGGGKALPAGGYICRILNAKKTTTKSTGLPMVEAIVDIIDGEYTQYFSKKYEENKQQHGKDAKFPNSAICRVVAVDSEGHQKKNFKSFCTAIEESNDMELPKDNDEAFINAIKGKEIGVLFGREQFESRDGKLLWSTKPKWFRSTESIMNGDFDIPADQFLETTNYPYASDIDLPDSFTAAEDDIPFA